MKEIYIAYETFQDYDFGKRVITLQIYNWTVFIYTIVTKNTKGKCVTFGNVIEKEPITG